MLATNTIWQGDTREVGLEQLLAKGCAIPRAVRSRKWPGTANLEVAHVWVRRGPWAGEYVLDDQPVPGITAFLTTPGTISGKPYRLAANKDKSFIGSYVLGIGFILTPEQAQELIARNPRNRDVLFPYLNGEDLNSRPDQSPSRWVINFKDWPLCRGAVGQWHTASTDQRREWLRKGIVPDDYPRPVAADYPDCLAIVEATVKPQREKQKDKVGQKLWWRFLRPRPELHATIAGMDRVLVVSLVNNHLGFAICATGLVFAHRLAVIPFRQFSDFAVIQSSFHYHWAWEYSSTMRRDINYSPSDCVETFPFPNSAAAADGVAEQYHSYRQSILSSQCQGLTRLYNRFHDVGTETPDIVRLRHLHIEMDRAVVNAYGWADLDLDHGFHETKQGVRFTISERARQEVLARLLALNHERYADEVRRGLHERTESRWSRADEEEAVESLFTEEEQG